MSASERVAELRAQADALETEAVLETALLAAKHAHTDNPSAETRAVKQEAAAALREARQIARADRVALVGGDAFVSAELEA